MPGIFIIVLTAKGKIWRRKKRFFSDKAGTKQWLGRGYGRRLAGGEQSGLLQQAAEIFFTGLVQRAFPGGEAGHGFIFDREPLQLHDADIFLAQFPNLTLAEFHARRDWQKICLP